MIVLENSKETIKSLFNLTRLAQLGVEVPQNLNEEFKQISSSDLTDAPNSVDANIRLASLQQKLEPIFLRLQKRRDDAQGALDKLRKYARHLISSDAGGKGTEIRSLLSRKSAKEIKQIYSRKPTDNPPEIWAALASPIADLLGIPAPVRKKIEQNIIESQPVFIQATATLEAIEAEITEINFVLTTFRKKVDRALTDHRKSYPGLMNNLEKQPASNKD